MCYIHLHIRTAPEKGVDIVQAMVLRARAVKRWWVGLPNYKTLVVRT